MGMGKPVIVTSVKPLKRIVEDAQCGLVVESKNSKEMAEGIIKLKEPSLAKELGCNGKLAIKDRYNWKHDERRLLSVYQNI